MTTHNIEEADRLCTKVAILHKGKFTAQGNPEDLKQSLASQRIVEITATRLPTQFSEGLSRLRGVEIQESRPEKCILRVRDPERSMPELLGCILHHQISLTGLTIRGPSLEDVMISHTGIFRKTGQTPAIHWTHAEKG